MFLGNKKHSYNSESNKMSLNKSATTSKLIFQNLWYQVLLRYRVFPHEAEVEGWRCTIYVVPGNPTVSDRGQDGKFDAFT